MPSAIRSPYLSLKVFGRTDSETRVSRARRSECISIAIFVNPSASVSAKVSGRWPWTEGTRADRTRYSTVARRWRRTAARTG
jgi:hypothetical protein